MPSIKRNIIYKLLYEILVIATPFITIPYVSRILGADGIGIYSYSQSCITYFTMFAILGTNIYGVREIARCRSNKKKYSNLFWEIEILTIITSSICLLLWVLIILFSTKYQFYFLALIPVLFSTLFDISWFFTGLERVGYTVILNALCKIIGTVLIFLLIKVKEDLVTYILLNSLTLMLGNLTMWLFLPKFLTKTFFKFVNIWNHFKKSLIYFIPTIAIAIYSVLDKTLIGLITDDSYQNGFYEQATKVIGIANTFSFIALNSVMTARLSYLFSEHKFDEAKSKITISMGMILFLATASMFGIIGIAPKFVPFFFGNGYEPVVILLYLMSPLIVIIGISNCIGCQYYTAIGKTKNASYYMIIGSIVNLVLNLTLIPFFGAKGAVIGSIGAEMVITLLFVHFDEKYLTWMSLLKIGYKKVIAGFIMVLIIRFSSQWLTFSEISSLCLQVFLGFLTYILVLVFLKDSTIQILFSLLSKFTGYQK